MKKNFLFMIILGGLLLSACAEPVSYTFQKDKDYLGGYVCYDGVKITVDWRENTFTERVINLIYPLQAIGDCSLVVTNERYQWIQRDTKYILIRK